MSDEAALLNAIAAHPEEDTPRLMFADWLEENGQPVRAEFIRVQIEKADCPADDPEHAVRFQKLSQREHEIEDKHRDELLGPVTSIQNKFEVSFSRGFPHFVVDVNVFVRSGHLFESLRPPKLTVTNGANNWYEFITHPHLPLVTHLFMSERWASADAWSLDPSIVGRLGEYGQHNRLRGLNLAGCGVSDGALSYLAEHAAVWRLEELDASSNSIFYFGLQELIESSIALTLRHFDLHGNPIDDRGANMLAKLWPADGVLEQLRLTNTNIGADGQQSLRARFGDRVEL